MSKLHSSSEVVKVLQREGFLYISQRGSHVKFRKLGNPTRTVIVPAGRKEIPRGTLRSIARQSGLLEQDFQDR